MNITELTNATRTAHNDLTELVQLKVCRVHKLHVLLTNLHQMRFYLLCRYFHRFSKLTEKHSA